jgi:hypothetical protein
VQNAQLSGQLQSAAKERNTLRITQEQMRRDLQRKAAEVEKAHNLLRDSGSAHDEAIAELCTLTMARGKDRAQAGVEQAALRTALEVERRRAAARDAREESRQAATRRGGTCSSVGVDSAKMDYCISSTSTETWTSGELESEVSEPTITSHHAPPHPAEAVAPSSSMAAMAAAADNARSALARSEGLAEQRRLDLQA